MGEHWETSSKLFWVQVSGVGVENQEEEAPEPHQWGEPHGWAEVASQHPSHPSEVGSVVHNLGLRGLPGTRP